MIKIQRDLAELLLCVVAKLLEVPTADRASLFESGYYAARNTLSAQGLKHTSVLFGIAQQGLDTPNFEEAFAELVAALRGSETSSASALEAVVDILSSPHSRNILSGENLRRLKQAILMPSDLTKVSEAMKKELSCSFCGKPFVSNEMVTAQDSGGGMVFCCAHCYTPSYSPCMHGGGRCKEVVEVDRENLRKLLAKNKCDIHSGKPAKPNLVSAADLANQHDRLGRPAAVRFAATPHPPPDPLFGAAVAAAPPPFRVAALGDDDIQEVEDDE